MRETVRAGSGWTASLGPGKTTWARELTGAFRAHGRPAMHLSTDDFHHPRARRHRQGRTSSAGYYADAYRRIRTRVHDLESDQRIDIEPVTVPAGAVVIADGTFLQRAGIVIDNNDLDHPLLRRIGGRGLRGPVEELG